MPAPKGNHNARKAKDWETALRYALDNYEGSSIKKGLALREIAKQLIEKALTGDLQAISAVADRLDGKPQQSISGDFTVNDPLDELSADDLSLILAAIRQADAAGTAGKSRRKAPAKAGKKDLH